MKAAERGCRRRNQPLTGAAGMCRTSQKRATMTRNATRKPTDGEATMGMTTLSSTPRHRTASKPTSATAAPTRPPMRACEELEGMPKYQVTRFQVMAPIQSREHER